MVGAALSILRTGPGSSCARKGHGVWLSGTAATRGWSLTDRASPSSMVKGADGPQRVGLQGASFVEGAGLCPRNDESAGRRRSIRLRKGAPGLKALLVQCAWAAGRTKGSYFQFLRLRGRCGPKKAACAVAASRLTTIDHMLKDGTQFQDLGADISIAARRK